MCCFSGPVDSVKSTRIFARKTSLKEQVLAYSMAYKSKADVAMVLPIPTPKGSAETAVTFVNLEGYDSLFDDLSKAFPIRPTRSWGPSEGTAHEIKKKLVVQSVGAFEASFVPSIKDFARLDERFRIKPETWEKLPGYKDFGFAVFKLKKGDFKVHPMAFRFPTAPTWKVFFPTVHIHDGKVHDKAGFDHTLYLQAPTDSDGDAAERKKWRESKKVAGQILDIKKCKGLLEKDQHLWQQRLVGKLKNQDTYGWSS